MKSLVKAVQEFVAEGHYGPYVVGSMGCELCGARRTILMPLCHEHHPLNELFNCDNCGMKESVFLFMNKGVHGDAKENESRGPIPEGNGEKRVPEGRDRSPEGSEQVFTEYDFYWGEDQWPENREQLHPTRSKARRNTIRKKAQMKPKRKSPSSRTRKSKPTSWIMTWKQRIRSFIKGAS